MENTKNVVVEPVTKEDVRKLDIGCGKNLKPDFEGVDVRNFGQKWHCDLTKTPWILTPFATRELSDGTTETYPVPGAEPIADNSIDNIHCSHFLEHLTADERVFFANELCRVLKKGSQAFIIVPSWTSERAYGDPTHKWPPVVPFSLYYWNKDWREVNAPHTGFTCDFDFAGGLQIMSPWNLRSAEVQAFAQNHYINVAYDMYVTVTKR